MTVGSRYRERVPPQTKAFRGLRKPSPGENMPQIGTLNEFFSSGKLFNSTAVRLTGIPRDSFVTERTWDVLHPGPPFKQGGPFAKLKVVSPTAEYKGSGTYYSADKKLSYVGSFVPTEIPVTPSIDTFVNWGNSQYALSGFPSVTGFHNQAWDSLRPKIDKAGFSQFIYELKDLPGMLKTSAKGFHDAWSSLSGRDGDILMRPKAAADHFLNHNFGWVPFINDLLKFYETYQRSEEYISRLSRDNGSWIKRRVVLKKTVSDVLLIRQYAPATQPSGSNIDQLCTNRQIDGIPCFGFTDVRSIIDIETWAEGSFKYYRPEFDPTLFTFSSKWSNTMRLLQLYGARINPSVLWKITPWSWLIDWFFSVGRNIDIANAWAEDSVVCRYAYIMHHQTWNVRQDVIRFFSQGPLFLSWPRTFETKQRVDAGSPYGFALNWADLSPKQYAILGAIGISRSNFG